MRTITATVGDKAENLPPDVNTVVELLQSRKKQTYYSSIIGGIHVPVQGGPDVATKLVDAIKDFQTVIQGIDNPDGVVSPNGNSIIFLGGMRAVGRLIIVDLLNQSILAYEAALLKFNFAATTGDAEHPTADRPSLHNIFRKHAEYRSKKYDAQMNYAMFFTEDGKAIHQSFAVGVTAILKKIGMGYFGSHGCVRLSEEDAKVLYDWAPIGTPVFVDFDRGGLD